MVQGHSVTGCGARVLPESVFQWLVVAIAAIGTIRLFQHPMWRDELQAWTLTMASDGLAGLISNLSYEAHPALWYLLLYPLTRVSADPLLMKAAQAVVVLATVALVASRAALTRIERVLILLSYFFFFEYLAISRSYGLTALLFLAHLWRSEGRGRADLLDWLLLGLLANTSIFGLILAVVSGAGAVWGRVVPISRLLPYLLLLVVAFLASTAVMLPKVGWAGGSLAQEAVTEVDPFRLVRTILLYVVSPFVPIETDFPTTYWPPVPGPGGMLTGVLLAAALPPVAFALSRTLRHDISLMVQFGLLVAAFITLAYLFHNPQPRYAGLLFVAFVGFLGLLRTRGQRVSRAALALLLLNAIGGIEVAIASAIKPFSRAEATADWIEHSGLARAFWIGTPDYAVTAIAGYLERPFYFLECRCEATFVRWSTERRRVDPQEVPRLVRAALEERGLTEGYFVINTEPVAMDAPSNGQGVRFEPLAEVTGGMVQEEDFRLYRARLDPVGPAEPITPTSAPAAG